MKNSERELVGKIVLQLKTLRIKHNLSHNKLALLSGVSRPAISQIENGKRTPTIGVCMKLARALDVSLGEIITHCERELSQDTA